MEGYTVKIECCSKELTAKERIRIKDFSTAIQLDDIIQPGEHFCIVIAYYAVMAVHNEFAKGDNKDYKKFVVVDQTGQAYITGSESFMTAVFEVMAEMEGYPDEEIQLDCYKLESKNYQGKHFLTCTVI